MKTKHKLLAAMCGIASLIQPALQAEEGGSGHYLPGSIASFVDAVPPAPTFVARLNAIYYEGSFGGKLPYFGLGPANVEAQSYAAGMTFLWRPKIELASGLSYAMSTTIPYAWIEAKGDVTAGPMTVRQSSRANGLGDIVLMPLMLNYELAHNGHVDLRGGIR